ncbi:MAG: sugar ABC transporter permease [Lachnospiraceae bacterium]|nr:sugar ABC transporter permease [Lachnospiraceae bacterium]
MKSLTEFKYILQNKKKRKRTAWKEVFIFLFPGLAGVAVFVLLPFSDVIRRSFSMTVTGEWSGIRNYDMVLNNQAFMLAAKNTLRFIGICLPLLIMISLFLAYRMSKSKYMRLLKSTYLLPMAIPAAAVVLIWKLLFDKQGILNGIWERLGGQTIDYMGTGAAFWVLVISYIWKNLGYTIVLWLAGIMGIPRGIIEAAEVDGAGEWTCFFRIILPNLKPTLYAITILSFLNSFKVFREAYLVAGSYPQESMYLLQHLFNNWFLNLEMDKMAAAAVLTAGVLLVFILLLQILWDRKEDET